MRSIGLNTINLGSLTGIQQAVLCVLLIIGSVIFVSMFIVLIRRSYFRKRLADLVQSSKAARKVASDLEQQEHRRDEGIA
jgi:predicted lipid-binding transport protein (Tim44 family)